MKDPVLRVYDPALCCETGVCGPEVDPALPRFAADLDWLKKRGVAVRRYNLVQEPTEFAANPVVRRALQGHGSVSLPLVLWADEVVATGSYPDREALIQIVGLPAAVGGGG